MKTLTTLAAAALVTFTLTTGTANAQMPGLAVAKAPAAHAGQDLVHKTGRRNRRRGAAAIALGIIGAAAIAHGTRHYYDERDDWRHERRCRRWMNRCEDGHRRSCWEFDRSC